MYIGRFAPSPTGEIHLGSLYIALASYLDAKFNQGQWIIRMDDVDQRRCSPEFSASIIETLSIFHLISDQEILYQAHQNKLYQDHINELKARGCIFYCTCSRKKLAAEPIYPGHCRTNKNSAKDSECAIRLRCTSSTIHFQDVWHDSQTMHSNQIGDIVIFRRDGFAAYHLATVIDDHHQQVSHVIRGSDLLSVTPCQIMIQAALGFRSPSYGHLPLVLGQDGNKLSKSNLSHPICASDPKLDPMLFLEQCRPWLGLDKARLEHCDHPKRWLEIASQIWQRDKIPSAKGFLFSEQLPTI